MNRVRISPRTYRALCVAALLLLCTIVVTGAAVRLTGSGLGCDDWPRCNDRQLIDVSTRHAAIEQINRLFTGLVALVVILAVLGSLVRTPRRRDLTWLSAGLVAGVIGQIVLGGVTVLVDLHPLAVQSHFLLSMALVANAVVLVHRAGLSDGGGVRRLDRGVRRHLSWCGAATLVAIALGTVVTGAGPHAGDEHARRFDLSIGTAARVHSLAVWVAVAVVVALMVRLRKNAIDRHLLDGPLTIWVCLAVAQGGIGYLQYFTGVPAALVAAHVAGATALWAATVWMIDAQWGDRVELKNSVDQALDERGGLVDHG
jgi:cytochrome c oxidase assembly protein subunit 15